MHEKLNTIKWDKPDEVLFSVPSVIHLFFDENFALMKNISLKYAFIILIANLAISAWFIHALWQHSNAYKLEKKEIAEMLSFNERLLDVKESIPLYGDWIWNHKKEAYFLELEKAKDTYEKAKYDVVWLVITNITFLFIAFFIYYKQNKWFALTFSLVMVSLSFYFAGIFTPMLEIEAYKQDLSIKLELDAHKSLDMLNNELSSIPILGESIKDYMNGLHKSLPDEPLVWDKVYPGKMYFFYENKNVLDVYNTLIKTQNYPIAALIILFTFLIPLLKLSFTLKMLFFPHRTNRFTTNFIHYLTKFSMVDVVVIALIVTFFSFETMSTGVETQATVLMGVYFFAAYVLCAMLSGLAFDRYKLKLKNESLNL
jgi:hypothetical protein